MSEKYIIMGNGNVLSNKAWNYTLWFYSMSALPILIVFQISRAVSHFQDYRLLIIQI